MIGKVEVEMREVDAEQVSGLMREFEDVVRNRGICVTGARWKVEEELPKEVQIPTVLEAREGAKETE